MRKQVSEYVRRTGRRTCSHGHEVNDRTAAFYSNGAFYCKECQRLKAQRQRARKKEEAKTHAGSELRITGEAAGVPEKVLENVSRKLRDEWEPWARKLGEVKAETLALAFDDLAARILASLDDEQIRRAAPRDRLWMAAVAVDKAQLLKGLPTQIVSTEQRIAMDRLLPALEGELRRRRLLSTDYEVIDDGSD